MEIFFEALKSEKKSRAIRLEAKKQDDRIVLTFLDDERRKWVME